MQELTHLSLFSGIGGLDLAAEMAGFRTVGQCEWADYPTKVLEKHWPDVPRWRDIRTLTGESFYERTGLRTVDVISGGFPCQPFSVAGKRRGKEDDRYLWPEMLRVISEIRPSWVVGENVAGIVSMALDQVLSDLESLGYACQAFIIPACAVDAPHRRDRCAIVAYNHEVRRGMRRSEGERIQREYQTRHEAYTGGENVADADGRAVRYDCDNWRTTDREINASDHACVFGGTKETATYSESTECARKRTEAWRRRSELGRCSWWPAEPDVGRVAHGVPSRVDRLECLGNAVVQQQFYPAFRAIWEIETIAEQWSGNADGLEETNARI